MSATPTKELEEARHIEREDDKGIPHPVETAKPTGEGYVVDNIAADYVDPNLHISPEEDKRLRRKIWIK